MDRFLRGLIGGLAGGVVMNIWSFFSFHILHFGTLRFVDWVSVLTYGHLTQNGYELVYSLILHLLWAGFLGVIFAYLIPAITSRGYLIKAILYGVVAGMIFYWIPNLFKVPNLLNVSLITSVSNHIGGILWAVTMVQTLRWLDHKVKG